MTLSRISLHKVYSLSIDFVKMAFLNYPEKSPICE